ncbi:MAG: DUF4136 domain-containing protein [Ignavibacteria bacterium]|nr:DUF4136 domain-containing protein [Ignavibacteria bacterium]
MKYIIPTLHALGIVASCKPDYRTSVEDYRTVVTIYDTSQNFNDLRTYYLFDTVHHLVDSSVVTIDEITRKYDQRLLSGVAGLLDSYGWVRITDTVGAPPATTVRITASSSTTWGYYYSWYPWYGYGGWWGYPGWGYPYYPAYGGYTYSYSTGSLFLQMDGVQLPSTAADSLQLRPLWIGSSNGLLSSSEADNAAIISNAVQQMFRQSPYLVLTEQ